MGVRLARSRSLNPARPCLNPARLVSTPPPHAHSPVCACVPCRSVPRHDERFVAVNLPTMPDKVQRDYAIKNEKETIEVETVKKLVTSYFNVVRKQMIDYVPKTVMAFLVKGVLDDLQVQARAHRPPQHTKYRGPLTFSRVTSPVAPLLLSYPCAACLICLCARVPVPRLPLRLRPRLPARLRRPTGGAGEPAVQRRVCGRADG